MSNTASNKPAIKPGSLCLVRGVPSWMVHPSVHNGMTVTAVSYKGTDTAVNGINYHNIWEVTNPAIEAYCKEQMLLYYGLPAQYLVPINDPGLNTQLLMEQLDE